MSYEKPNDVPTSFLAQDSAAGVGLRSLHEEDAAGVFSGWSDAEVLRSFREGNGIRRDIEEARAYVFFSRGMGEQARELAIDYKGEFAGCFSWRYEFGVWKGNVEISYWLLPEMRAKGIAKKAIELSLYHLFEKRRERRIFAWVAADNIASQWALEAAGLQKDACFRQALWIEDRAVDALYYSILAQEYRSATIDRCK